MTKNLYKTTAAFISILLVSCNLQAAINIGVAPDAWNVPAGASGEYSSPGFRITNAGDPVRINAKASNTPKWYLSNIPRLNAFALKWGSGSTFGNLSNNYSVMFPYIATNEGKDFSLTYYSPTYNIPNIADVQISSITLTAVSSYMGNTWNLQSAPISGMGQNSSIAMDKAGYFHVAFASWPVNNLMYSNWQGEAEVVSTNPVYGSPIYLIMDNEGQPRILYLASVSNYGSDILELLYAWRDSVGWHTSVVSDQVAYWQSSGMFAFSLALDSRNMPHVASVYGGNVDYSSFNGSEWSVESVPEIYMPSGDYISIKVDPNDVVHMACANYSEFTGNQSLRYAVRSNTGIWTHKTIVETGAAASELLLDSQNKPYIAAVLYDPWQANVYKLDSEGNWTPFCPIPEELATDSKVILTLDSNGYPRIPYMSSLDSGFAIRYGQWTGMEWLSSDIVADPQYNSVAFSVGFAPSGKPVVGFIPWNFGYDHVDNFSYATLE